jgi:hypothetical protein
MVAPLLGLPKMTFADMRLDLSRAGDETLIPITEVRRILGVSPGVFYGQIRPTLKVVVLSHKRRGVRLGDLRRWMAERQEQA